MSGIDETFSEAPAREGRNAIRPEVVDRPETLPAPSLAVVSGKGGVGKTSLAVNLSVALAALGQRVVLVDGDLALGKVDLLLGAEPEIHLGHVLQGTASVRDALQAGPGGVKFLPGACGAGELAVLGRRQRDRLFAALGEVSSDADQLVLDLATGIGPNAIELALRVERVLLLTTPEPTALTDAYAVFKILAARGGPVPGVVVNRVRNAAHAEETYRRIAETARRHLGLTPAYWGALPEDRAVRRAVEEQVPFVLSAPSAPASRAVRALAWRLLGALGPEGDAARSDRPGLTDQNLIRLLLPERTFPEAA